MNSTLKINTETKNKKIAIPILFMVLFIFSSIPFNITYYFTQGSSGFKYYSVIRSFCSLLSFIFFYPIVNFFEKILHISTVSISYVISGILFYILLGYVLELFFRKIGIKNIILRIILGLFFLPILGLIYMSFSPSLF